MEDALIELESFQTSSYDHPDVINDYEDDGDYPFIDKDAQFIYSSMKKHSNNNHELSLLFPTIKAGETAVITANFNDVSASLSGSSVPSVCGNSRILPKENTDDLADEQGVWRARWLLVAAAALYGTNFSVVKLLNDEMPVGISTSLRFGLAALATLPWLVQGFLPKLNLKANDFDRSEIQLGIARSDQEFSRRVKATMYGLEIGLWNSIGYVAQAVGLETTLASESAFLCSMAVVIVPLLDWIAGKRLLPRQWVGALMALLGIAFLELGDVGALLSSSGTAIAVTTGDKLSLMQPFFFGLGFWRMEQAMDRFPQEARRMTAAQLMAIFISSIGYCSWSLGVFGHVFDGDKGLALAGFQSSLATISASFPWKEWFTNPSILLSLFWTGCVTTALTIYMETLALESLSAAETTLIFSTEPLWGTAFAVTVMGEQMGVNSAIGGGMILLACVYSNLGVQGLQEIRSSAMANILANEKKDSMNKMKASSTESSSLLHSLQGHWPWLQSALAGGLVAWNIASNTSPQTQELEDIVEELIENMVDKL
jgi:drug/metabolite transporter (DMT)-like permease